MRTPNNEAISLGTVKTLAHGLLAAVSTTFPDNHFLFVTCPPCELWDLLLHPWLSCVLWWTLICLVLVFYHFGNLVICLETCAVQVLGLFRPFPSCCSASSGRILFCMLVLHSRSLHLWFSFSPSFGSTSGKNFQPYLLTQKRRLNSQLYHLLMTLCLVLTVSREGWISSFSVFWWRAVLFRQWAEELSLKHYSSFLPLFKCISIYFK